MSDLGAPSVLEELLTLWRIATPAERARFLATVAGIAAGGDAAGAERGAPTAAGCAR